MTSWGVQVFTVSAFKNTSGQCSNLQLEYSNLYHFKS